MREKAREIAELMGLMANENRLLILCALLNGPMTVSELRCEVTDISLSAFAEAEDIESDRLTEKRAVCHLFSERSPPS